MKILNYLPKELKELKFFSSFGDRIKRVVHSGKFPVWEFNVPKFICFKKLRPRRNGSKHLIAHDNYRRPVTVLIIVSAILDFLGRPHAFSISSLSSGGDGGRMIQGKNACLCCLHGCFG